jgi:RNA polymerase sigma-70 factor (ECF subfamily)
MPMQAELASHRHALWKLCYRMTGSSAEADDLVQETFRRALETPPSDTTRDLRPWLTRVALNLSRDALRARKRRAYVGPWLPSPIETERGFDPSLMGADARYSELESVTFAFLVALEVLSGTQRAVLLLRDVLDYSVEETAQVLEISPANVKTSLHRARKAMEAYDASALALTPERVAKTAEALRALCIHLFTRNVPALEALLAREVRARNDGGGEFFAAQRPVFGLSRVIKFHLKTSRRGLGRGGLRVLNGLPALVAELPSSDPRLASRVVVRIELDAADKIVSIDTVVAAAKLHALDFTSLTAPSPREWGATLWAALRAPSPRVWLPGVLRNLASAARRRSAQVLRSR